MTQTRRPSTFIPPAASYSFALHSTMRNTLIASVACGFILLTLVVVVQAKTIETQRNLIRDLFADSADLRALREAHAAENRAKENENSKSVAPNAAQLPPVLKAPPLQTPNPPVAKSHPKMERQGRKKLSPNLPPLPPRAIDAAQVRRDASIA